MTNADYSLYKCEHGLNVVAESLREDYEACPECMDTLPECAVCSKRCGYVYNNDDGPTLDVGLIDPTPELPRPQTPEETADRLVPVCEACFDAYCEEHEIDISQHPLVQLVRESVRAEAAQVDALRKRNRSRRRNRVARQSRKRNRGR